MTKQEKIKDGIKRLLTFMRNCPEPDPIDDDVEWMMRCLDLWGVVIKVDRELPRDCQYCEFHHCFYDSDGIQDCSCGLSCFANTCSHGIPESCPLKLVCAFEPLIGE